MAAPPKVNIRPGVSVLSVLRHLNYTYWHALAEFVDNSVQSWRAARAALHERDSSAITLIVEFRLHPHDGGALTIRDNAAGIPRTEFARAFKAAAPPTDKTGLSEFGMGMKSAACWCARKWSVRTKPLDDEFEYLVTFDVEEIVAGQVEVLDVVATPAAPEAHYTEISLEGLHKIPTGRTLGKIKAYLADIYRGFTRTGELVLTFDGQPLVYEEPRVLVAPFYKDDAGPAREWRIPIDFDFGDGLRAHGFAALLETMSPTRSGFALFRRGRVIQGVGEEGYRPKEVSGQVGSHSYKRLFGELHLEGFNVSHTKDGFKWDDNEEVFLEILKEYLSTEKLPLLQQARGYRVGESTADLAREAEAATISVGDALERSAGAVVAELRADQAPAHIPHELAPIPTLARREITLVFEPWTWVVSVEQSADPAAHWLEISEYATRPDASRVRRLGIRISLAHAFMMRFAGADADRIEPLLRLAVALGLAETIAREAAEPGAFGRVRQNVNEILRRALSAP